MMPISTFELLAEFPDEESARRYLEGRLWAHGVKCPECRGKERITKRKNGYYRCNPCTLDFTIRTGTIFERSHVPLHKWMYLAACKGISSLQLAKEIGVTYKSARFMLQRLREACSQNSDKLRGIVEIDQTKDAIADAVLAYKPKPKTKAAKRRKRRAQNALAQGGKILNQKNTVPRMS